MRVHYISVEKEKGTAVHRCAIGGYCLLAPNQEWPHCRLCRGKMLLFMQFDLEKRFEFPLKSGSHLSIFMCPTHNDAPALADEFAETKLPPEYWNRTFGHYKLFLNHPKLGSTVGEKENRLLYQALHFAPSEEDVDWDGTVERGRPGFKVGGVPGWLRNPEVYRCACGAEMIFLCQIPRGFGFAKTHALPKQQDGMHSDAYCLFLGQEVYVFACKDMCTPNSLWTVAQAVPTKELEVL